MEEVEKLCVELNRIGAGREENPITRARAKEAAATLERVRAQCDDARDALGVTEAQLHDAVVALRAAEAQALAWQRRSEQFEEQERLALVRNDDLWVQVEAMRNALAKARVAILTWSPDSTEPLEEIDAALASSTPESSVEAPERITWRGVSRIEYAHAELLDLLDSVQRNTGGNLHNIVSAFNGNTLIRLISQADRALPNTPKGEAQ